MKPSLLSARVIASSLIFSLSLLVLPGHAQQPQNPPSDQEIIRISTELAQTSVVVVDKQNKFVAGLGPKDFQLSVDGKPATVSFVEHVVAGTMGEESMTARRVANPGATSTNTNSVRGRTIIFFIDDLHLSAAAVGQTKRAFLDFVENQMGPEDQVAVASPSGQIGFLQTFTDVKPVLRAAIARLNHRPYVLQDGESIPMTEYQALRIDQGDRDTTDYYTVELLKSTNYTMQGGGLGPPPGGPAASVRPATKGGGGMSREMAERNVKNRAQVLLRQSAAISVNTLTTLEGLMRSSGNLPGRKLLFLISDGFYLNDRNTAFGERLKQITDAATRAGVVIYTMDGKGFGASTDASSNRADADGRLARSSVGERTALQDPLTAMADNTGGRAFLSADAIATGVKTALNETSNYYILAWRPEVEEQKGGKFKQVEVNVVGHPELTVRLPRGFFAPESKGNSSGPNTNSEAAKETSKPPAEAIREALTAATPKSGLPTQLALSFVDAPNAGPLLTVSTQIATDVLGYGADGKETAAIDLAGVVIDDRGKQLGGFKTRINVKPASQNVENPGVIYNHKVTLKPGIYQVRVAAQDEKSGRVGSTWQWIDVPDLASKRLTLSSLLVGGQFIGSSQKESSDSPQVQFSVDRRFRHGSHLNFLLFIYNATRINGSPDLENQIQISRGGQPVVTTALRKVPIEPNGDLSRIPYGADVALQNLPAGRYVLKITITDRAISSSVTQQTTFEIE